MRRPHSPRDPDWQFAAREEDRIAGAVAAFSGGAGGVARISKQKIVVLLDRGEQTDAIAAARDADIVIVVSTMVPTGRVTKYRHGPHDDIDLVVVR